MLEDARQLGGFDAIWMLGDVVGYGPDPDACIALLGEYPLVCIAGNHDLGVIGRVSLSQFNSIAAEACLWTRRRLSLASWRFLSELPLRSSQASFVLVHGSPRDPIWEYVTGEAQAKCLASFCEKAHCLAGHTHRPLVLSMTEGEALPPRTVSDGERVVVRGRLIINPGAVGQPRDGDPRAAYGLLSTGTGTVSLHRVSYDVEGTAAAMRVAGLPLPLATRLHAGY